jgi:hypothetical protein
MGRRPASHRRPMSTASPTRLVYEVVKERDYGCFNRALLNVAISRVDRTRFRQVSVPAPSKSLLSIISLNDALPKMTVVLAILDLFR